MNDLDLIQDTLILLGEYQHTESFAFKEARTEWAVTNQPPIGEPIEQERELTFDEPSSVVGLVTYNPDLQNMTIELNGKLYNFCNVPQRVFEAFRGAGSKGAYFGRNIRGLFNC